MTLGPSVAANATAAPSTLTNANTSGSDIHADLVWSISPTSVTAPHIGHSTAGMSPAKVWAACGVFDSNTKVVRQFGRKGAHPKGAPAFKTGRGTLACGSADDWGYRHIKKGHLSQWEYRAEQVASNWRDVADFGMNWALKDPSYVTYRSKNHTYCYGRPIYLLNKKTHQRVGKYQATVVVAHGTQNIITAFPPSKRCCKNN